jgi:hypothetical protein
MTPPTNPDHHPIDDIVRDHLDRQAAGVDARCILAGVKDRSRSVPSAGPTRRKWLRVAVGAGAGAAVAAGLGGLYFFGETPPVAPARAATAEELVREAKEVHARPTDRCYDVTAEWEPALFQLLKLPPIVRKSRLWTRGDQFWIESGADGAKAAWGQDSQSRVWVALTRKHGLRYEPAEVGDPVARYCDLMSLRMVSTLAEVLETFDLFRKDGGAPGEPIRIEAAVRQPVVARNLRFREIALTLDPDTKVVRQAALKRQVNGVTVASLTFNLADTSPQPDERYELRGHLDADAEVLDGTDRRRLDRRTRFRDEFLRRIQGRLK